MKVLVTGANGFVGRAVWLRLNAMNGVQAVASVRRVEALTERWASVVSAGELSAQTDWSYALAGVDAVVHTAARVHVMNDKSLDALAEFRRVNVEGTAALARQAAATGVRRFVFLSSIKVNGDFTKMGKIFTADDVPAPEDSYGISKHEAEQLLRQIAFETGMEVVIIRPPLVYGPGVKANFQQMMRWLARGLPLPLAGVDENRRSLVALDNLVDLIVTCLRHPAAANHRLLVSAGEDLSTAMLIRRMGNAQSKPVRLFHMPSFALKIGAEFFGVRDIYRRLCSSLQVDISKTRALLGWTPPVSVDEGLRRAFAGFRV
jgi:nucleoside-diphosphate-sugar epimerase